MPTTVTTTVGTSHTYSTVAAWLTNQVFGVDLVGTNDIQEGNCYNDTEFTAAGPVAAFDAGSYTSDATRYPLLDTAALQSFRDQPGVRTNALFYNQANGVGLRNTGSSGYTVNLGGGVSAVLQNLQVKGDAGSSGTIGGALVSGTYSINNLIIVGTEMYLQNSGITFNNCLIVNTLGPHTRLFGSNATGTLTFNFCTFIANPSLAYYVNYDSATTMIFNNCAFFGAGTTAFHNGSPTSETFTNCMTDITGTTGLIGGVAFSTSSGAKFQSLTNDFRVQSGSTLDNSASPIGITTDISGFTRKATPTIGAWEVAGGAAPPTYFCNIF